MDGSMDGVIDSVTYVNAEPNRISKLAIEVAKQKEAIMRTQTVEEYRKSQKQLADLRPVHPLLFALEREVIAGVPCEWIAPRIGRSYRNLIIYIHGGSWMFGDLDTARPGGEMLVRETGYTVLVVDYRRAPEDQYPAGFKDCLRVYKAVVERGYHIVLFGDSAGGNYCLALLNQLKWEGSPLPICVGLASPVTDMRDESHLLRSEENLLYTVHNGKEESIFRLYLGDEYFGQRSLPTISPVTAELGGLPPILIHAGSGEAIAKDCVEFAEKVVAGGGNIQVKIWHEMFHDFTLVGTSLSESRDSMRELGQFFKVYLKGLED